VWPQGFRGGWMSADSGLPLALVALVFWLGRGLGGPWCLWPLVRSGVPGGQEFADSDLRPSWPSGMMSLGHFW
jgi:hypothetical protein